MLAAVVEFSEDAIISKDLNGTIRSWNQAAQRIFGYTQEEVIGQPISILAPSPELNESPQILARIRRGQRIEHYETIRRRKDGELIRVSLTVSPIRNKEGVIVGASKIARDVTERHRTEQALRESEQRLRKSQRMYQLERERLTRIFEQAPVGMAVLKGERLIFETANAPYRSFVPGREIVGRSIFDVIPELDPNVLDILYNVLHTGQSFRCTDLYVPLDRDQDGVNEDCWFDVLYHPLIEEDGTISSVIAVATDVTGQVLAKKELEHQRRMFDAALSSTPDYFFMFDRQGRVMYVNHPFSATLQRPVEEIVGYTLGDLGYPADFINKLKDQLEHVFVTGETVWDEALFAPTSDELRNFEYILAPILKEDGTVEAVAGSSRDITERKRGVETLRRSNEELKRTNRELEEFAFVASHDLQEPLRMVGAYTQLLLRRLGPQSNPSLEQYAGFVQQGVKRMEELIDDLLLFSRTIHAERQAPQMADLEESLQVAIGALRSQIEKAEAHISSDPLPQVMGDQAQFVHVFQNLLSNSLKYRSPERKPEIRIGAEQSGDDWTISITDNGIGFDQVYAERIFGLFKRLHKDEYPGTGLGLAICLRIVERFGGRIWAQGALGKGSQFFFTATAAAQK